MNLWVNNFIIVQNKTGVYVMYATYARKNMLEYLRILQKIAYVGYLWSSFDVDLYDMHNKFSLPCYWCTCGTVYVQGMTEAGSDPYGQVKQMDKRRAEPEKIRIWREEQAEMLKKKGKLSWPQ